MQKTPIGLNADELLAIKASQNIDSNSFQLVYRKVDSLQ